MPAAHWRAVLLLRVVARSRLLLCITRRSAGSRALPYNRKLAYCLAVVAALLAVAIAYRVAGLPYSSTRAVLNNLFVSRNSFARLTQDVDNAAWPLPRA